MSENIKIKESSYSYASGRNKTQVITYNTLDNESLGLRVESDDYGFKIGITAEILGEYMDVMGNAISKQESVKILQHAIDWIKSHDQDNSAN